jgi:hypothetical protein
LDRRARDGRVGDLTFDLPGKVDLGPVVRHGTDQGRRGYESHSQ